MASLLNDGDDEAPVPQEQRAALRERIKDCYRENNAAKLGDGSVDELLAKYEGQEHLLLRRVRHRYGLVCLRGRLAKRSSAAASDWRDVEVAVRADGELRWADDGGASGRLDARRCAVDAWGEKLAGRPWAFAVFSVDGGDDGGRLVLAAASEAERETWVAELEATARFFARLDRERAYQREEESLVRSAVDDSARTLEADQRRLEELARLEDLETRRGLAASELADEERRRASALPDARAMLESALDDALRHATEANALETRRKHRKAHDAYARAVAAFVAAKRHIVDMPADARPERDVMDMIDSGSLQCRQAADACRARGARGGGPAAPGDAPAAPDPFAAPGALLDAPRRVPASVEKLILDADDV